eukprot:CAMPEP_0119151334 /NCGR_PEP_ID=MMETSP1310-20130426/46181_1 /TAXON_ID=464262 /ORGANISM="Genus nov. species nov., Strain RCC2339" /LENGTH=93 /DNA_ID=CAMNT_0007143601 /DNA_START=73 /DNA_END=351 /DNA_ORIENTATION=-
MRLNRDTLQNRMVEFHTKPTGVRSELDGGGRRVNVAGGKVGKILGEAEGGEEAVPAGQGVGAANAGHGELGGLTDPSLEHAVEEEAHAELLAH